MSRCCCQELDGSIIQYHHGRRNNNKRKRRQSQWSNIVVVVVAAAALFVLQPADFNNTTTTTTTTKQVPQRSPPPTLTVAGVSAFVATIHRDCNFGRQCKWGSNPHLRTTVETLALSSYWSNNRSFRLLLASNKNNDIQQNNDDKKRKQKRRRKPASSTQTQRNGSKSPTNLSTTTKVTTWRVFGVEVHPDLLVTDNNNNNNNHTQNSSSLLHPEVLNALRVRLQYPTLSIDSVTLVRRSIDARSSKKRSDDGTSGPRYVYVLDVVVDTTTASGLPPQYPWKIIPGRLELLSPSESVVVTKTDTQAASGLPEDSKVPTSIVNNQLPKKVKSRVVIVGAGPAGLFCAMQLARTGLVSPIVLERGQPVETRGKDIGALIHRQQLDPESNFAFGEGGAGTWSDGKLTTRIGRNSDAVRFVLETFVQYGAPSNILVEGAPHLGTDNLVRLLRNMRTDLRRMGGEIQFGTKVTGLVIEDGVTKGVDYIVNRNTMERNMQQSAPDETIMPTGTTGRLYADAVVLATGHSARDIYEQIHAIGVQLEAKGFAVGFRVEHPQKLINKIQYGNEWGPSVLTGKATTDLTNKDYFEQNVVNTVPQQHHRGVLPVPSYRLATNEADDGDGQYRGVYSFCMCPGGQIVPASTNVDEVCVNGMSFSRRDSLWANSALVVTIEPDDVILEPYRNKHGILAGIAFQRDMEQRASVMGGGNFTVPVQRVTDFLAGRPSESAPSSSYRLGTKPSACHEIYPPRLVVALRHALTEHFDRQMPGFVCDEGLLHAVETRTSSPVRITRNPDTLQAVGTRNLYPAGEGAGFAGGIVSAAVDGMVVADAILANTFGVTS